MKFAGKHVVVTGASSGIGRALALEFASQGARIGAVARRAELLQDLTTEIRTRGGTAESACADVTDRESLFAAIHSLASQLGPVDLLIANAGVGYPTGADPMNVPGVEMMTRVNFLGVVYAFEAVLPEMLKRGQGQLVAISSLASYRGLPGAAGYCASKVAVNNYCEALRIELRSRGIAVTTICPGFIRTAMTAQNKDPMPFLMDADVAARKMARAIVSKKKVYNFPWRLYRMILASRWLPDWLIAKFTTRPTFPE